MVMEYPDILTDKNSHVEYRLCHSDRCQQILSLKVDGLFSVSLSRCGELGMCYANEVKGEY